MNWINLKKRFPNSEQEIREWYDNSIVKDAKTVLEMFLKSKGFDIRLSFIYELKEYEFKVKNINLKKDDIPKQINK